MLHRRDFFAASTFGTGCLLLGRNARSAPMLDETWLNYAIDVELFWKNLPFVDRLKKVAEAGFSSYEFGPFKAKDLPAIDKVSRDLNLTPVQFSAYRGNIDPKSKEPFLDAIDDAIEAADMLGVKKLVVVPGEVVNGMERDAMIDALVDALKEAADKAKDRDLTILLEPSVASVRRPARLVATPKDAAEVIDAVGSPNLKFLFDVDHEPVTEENPSADIKKYFPKIGYFRVADQAIRLRPGTGKIDYARILKTIHDLGYVDPIGLKLGPKGDPIEALKVIRDVDAAARSLR